MRRRRKESIEKLEGEYIYWSIYFFIKDRRLGFL